MPLSKGRLGTIKEGILSLSECDLHVARWMTVELSLHHVAGRISQCYRIIFNLPEVLITFKININRKNNYLFKSARCVPLGLGHAPKIVYLTNIAEML